MLTQDVSPSTERLAHSPAHNSTTQIRLVPFLCVTEQQVQKSMRELYLTYHDFVSEQVQHLGIERIMLRWSVQRVHTDGGLRLEEY